MFEGTGLVLGGLLGLPAGLEVELVEAEADGSFSVHVRTAASVVARCPGCGTPAGGVKETVQHTVRHLPVTPLRVTWHKQRMVCGDGACARGSFVEDVPLAVPGGRVSVAALETMGHLVGDWMVPVSRVAGVLGASWHTAHGGFVRVADQAAIVVTDQTEVAEVAEVADQAEVAGSASAAGPADTDDAEAGEEPAGEAGAAAGPKTHRSASGPLPDVSVLGLDDHRRGGPRWHRDPASGRYVADADRWQTVLIDAAGSHGLLGVVEGRAAGPVTGWILDQPAAWRARIWAVTIDMSGVYKAAARAALPHTILAVDPFHVAQLANKAVGDVRRRATHRLRRRRGRATDPE